MLKSPVVNKLHRPVVGCDCLVCKAFDVHLYLVRAQAEKRLDLERQLQALDEKDLK